MNRSICRMLIAWFAALWVLAPSVGWAGTPYTVHWAVTQENPACETAALGVHDGKAFFHVNDTPVPTYEIPGAFSVNADGTESNKAEAGFDSVLLRTGTNDFSFLVTNDRGNDACVHSHNVVSLVSAPLGLNKPLFDVRRDGTAFIGNSQVDLSLAEINPPLARDIANLEVAIAEQRKSLIANASKTAKLAEKLSMLQQLDTELHDLVNRPLDEIAQTDLDEILDRYADVVDDATKAALDQLINDLQKSITDLENELASLIDNFGAQADAVVDLATQDAQGAGWKPDDPSNYGLGPGGVPWVDIPDISSVPGAFTPGNDPYDAYAEAVIAALAADVSGSKVIARADFVANVRAWRANQKALEQALAMRMNVPLAETNAFLNAQNKVTSYVQKFMDGSGWFKDSPVPADLRADVDGVLKNDFGPLADEMKDALNLWEVLDQRMTMLSQTIDAFANAIAVVGNGAAAYGELMVTLVHATERVAIGFVPYVGPALDLCEAITGKEWCLPGGKDLSTEERIFSGAGVAVAGVAKFWGGAKNAAISPAAKLVADETALLTEEFALALRSSRRTWYKTLRGAVTSAPVDPFEMKAALHLLQNEERALIGVGDDGVRTVLGMPKQALEKGDAMAADFLSATKGNKLAVSEVKGGLKNIDLSPKEGALRQLKNTVDALQAKGLAGDVERVELIIRKGAKFSDPNYVVRDGLLINTINGNKAVELAGYKNLFIRVIEL